MTPLAWQWAGRAARALDVPVDVFGESRITLLGGRRLLIENHQGLLQFSSEEIVVRLPSGAVAVAGHALVIEGIQPDRLQVQGVIREIRLEQRGA